MEGHVQDGGECGRSLRSSTRGPYFNPLIPPLHVPGALGSLSGAPGYRRAGGSPGCSRLDAVGRASPGREQRGAAEAPDEERRRQETEQRLPSVVTPRRGSRDPGTGAIAGVAETRHPLSLHAGAAGGYSPLGPPRRRPDPAAPADWAGGAWLSLQPTQTMD
ncbi:hypothetical protein NDU88_005281 [Pleurodeles waltl]|uniref:Uncharacterized protein n=1 Tax=Pleurodeles waltl TaxID=8319 RepID=A0AAV7UJI2_PLEWA|nr:hypothetical protein NDU88_005281 [Pleurodeles waltl]